MSAGNWDDVFPPEGVTHLGAGVYCLNDDFIINGNLTGNNVVFKVEHGEVPLLQERGHYFECAEQRQ